MIDDYRKRCPKCLKLVPLFLTRFCGPCTYRAAAASKKASEARAREMERSRDTSGTVGDPRAEAANLARFDAHAAKVRADAGVPRRA